MNPSPWFTGSAPNFGPPAGMASLIAQGRDTRIDMSGFQQFADAAEQFKSQRDMGKAADYFVKANPQALAAAGIHPDQWETLGAREKSAAVTGLIKGQGAQEAMQRMALVGQQLQAARNEADANQGFGQAMQDAAATAAARGAAAPNAAADEEGTDAEQEAAAAAQGQGAATPTMGDIMQGMAKYPKSWAARDARPLLNYHLLQQAQGGANNPLVIDKDSVPGYTIVKPTVGSNFQALPAPAEPGQQALEQTDEDGNVVARGFPTSGGKIQWQQVKPAAAPKLPDSFHKTMDDLSEQMQIAQGNIGKSDAELQADRPKAKPADVRASAVRALATAKQQAKNTVDRYYATGSLNADTRDLLYQQIGVAPPAAPAAAAPAGARGVAPAEQQGLIDQANAAIKNGADPKAVKARLKSKYGIVVQ